MNSTNPALEVILNGQLVAEYQRNSRLAGKQREFLDIMDIDMDKGVKLDGKVIKSPDDQQRSHYISMELIQAVKSNNRGMITASCAYLANRHPTLQKIMVKEEGETISLELLFD